MLTMEILERQNKRLREENDELREALRQARTFGDATMPLPSWLPRLTPFEEIMFRQLLTGRIISRDRLLSLIYGGQEPAWANTIDVVLSRIRKKVRPHGLVIVNQFGAGWHFDDASMILLGKPRRATGVDETLTDDAETDLSIYSETRAA